MIESRVGAMSTLLPRAIREAGHRFTFITRDLHHYLRARHGPGPHPLLAADNVLSAETNDLSTLLPFVERAHGLLGFDGVTSSCDHYLSTAASAAGRLGLPGPRPDAVDRAFRKDRTRTALAEAGVPGPRFALAETWADTAAEAALIGYPLVVKPVDLGAGMFVRVVANETELRDAFLALEAFPVNARQQPRSPVVLLEELLTGPEVSVETVTIGEVTHVVGVTAKSVAGAPWFLGTAHLFPADLPDQLRGTAAETAVAAVSALGLTDTVAHTEIKLTPDGPRIVEVDPRPGGDHVTELVRRVTGIDLPMVYAQLALGASAELAPVDTGARSAGIAFLLPPRAGVVAEVVGAEDVRAAPGVVEVEVVRPGHRAIEPTSNNACLGHVMVVDSTGAGARDRAEELLAKISVRYAEGDGPL